MKKILVCIKAVPEILSPLLVDTRIPWLAETSLKEYRMNRFDEFALEEALCIREAFPQVTVDAVSVGPEDVQPVLRRAMAVGADNAVHIRHETQGFCEAKQIAGLIAAYAASGNYDLILTGVMAEDDMQSLVGPFLAAMLDFTCATSVVRQTIIPAEKRIQVECEMEGGLSEKISLAMPALLTIQSGINRPRYPSLSNMLRSRSKQLICLDSTGMAAGQAEIAVHSLGPPPESSRCVFLTGSAAEKAEKLLQILNEKSLLQKSMGIG